MIMGASTFPGPLVRGSRMRFAIRGRGLGDLLSDCEGPHPNCSPLDQACVANWQNIISSCQPVPAGAGITRQLSTSSPKFAAMLAAAGGDEMLALQAMGNPVLPSYPSAAWWGGAGATVSGNPMPHSSSRHNPGATPTNPIQQQVRINPTNLPIRPLHPRPPLRGGYGGYGTYPQLPPGVVMPGYYSTVPRPLVATGLGRLGQVPLSSATATGPTAASGYTGFVTYGYSGPISTPSGGVANVNLSLQQLNDALMKTWGQPRAPTGIGFSASGYAQNVLQFIKSGVLEYDPTTDQWNVNSKNPKPPTVVNPSPSTQLTNTGTSQASPTSVLNVASGVINPPLISSTGQVSTVGGTVSGSWFTDPTQDIITGLPNWALLVMAGSGLFLVVRMASKR